MYTLPIAYAMADGSLPRFGDDVNSRVSTAQRYLEFAHHAYRDPAMLPYLSSRPNWTTVLLGRTIPDTPKAPPALKSHVFTGAGHAILRTQGKAGLTGAFTFGPYGGFHGHFDKLSFVFFGYGQELGVDPGRARSQAYRLPIHRKWYKATIAHNTVLVDRASQQPAAGKLECFAANERYAAAAASCTAAYPGVEHRRFLCMTPSYLLVYDELSAERERRYDWIYHNRGAEALCETAREPAQVGTEDYAGLEYVENLKGGFTDMPVRVVFPDKNVTTNLVLAARPGTGVHTGNGVGASILDRVPLVMVARRGKVARFCAVLEPVSSGAKPTVRAVTCAAGAEEVTITVETRSGEDHVMLTLDHQIRVRSRNRLLLDSARPRR
jgi:hypothetical protein